MPKQTPFLIRICQLGLVIGLLASASPLSGQSLQTRQAGNQAFELELERLINDVRILEGIPPLKHNQILTESARAHNQDMITSGNISHTGSDGSLPPDRACAGGYRPYSWGNCYVGENINAGDATPELVLQAWVNSPGHLGNLLNEKYREFGVGHTTGGAYGNYWTLDLGAQPFVLPIFINNDEEETQDRPVTITLTTEGVSWIGSMGPLIWIRASEDQSFPGAQWNQWSESLPFTLSPGNGIKTVYVEFFDGIDRVTSSDSIFLSMPPTLSVTPQSLFFLVEKNTVNIFPGEANVIVSNLAGDPLEWEAAVNESWLSIGTSTGTTPSALDVSIIPAEIDTSTTGTFSATITITATTAGVVNSPQEIMVKAKVVEEIYSFYLPSVYH